MPIPKVRFYRNTPAISTTAPCASFLGRALEQEEIDIAYGDRTWTVTAEPQPDR
jgi:hypothetical protein